MSRGTSPWDRDPAISDPSPRTDRSPATTPRRALVRGDLPDNFARSLYRLSPYRGCAHGCRYCDGRAEKYYVTGDFERDIIIRDDLPDRLARELPGLREDGMIAIGSGTTDAYQPCEASAGITRRCVEALVAYAEASPATGSRPRLPVLVMTKSALALRDLPLWRRVNEAAGFLLLVSLTSLDEGLRAVMEPGASSLVERLELLRAFKGAGCPVGVLAMPLLPGLSDEAASIRHLYETCAGIGVDFIMPGGLTLRPGRQKDLYLETLAGYRPDLLESTCTLYREERASGMPLRSALLALQESIASIRHEFRIPRLLPHAIHARLLPPWDSFHILLLDMAELYAERGNDTRALREATHRYDTWLLNLRRFFRRRRSLPPAWFPERFAEALESGELHRVLENDRLAGYSDTVLRDGARLDYGSLTLSQPGK